MTVSKWVRKHVRLSPTPKGTAMSNRGTPYEVNPGQLATIISRIVVALPKALELSHLDAKTVLELTNDGQGLSRSLGDMLARMAEPPTELTVHRLPRTGHPTLNWPVVFFDTYNATLLKVDPAHIKLRGLEGGEVCLTGHQMRDKLLQEGFVLLDSAVMDALMTCPSLIPKEMKLRYIAGTRRIFFDGVSVRDPGGAERSFFIQFHPTRNVWEEDAFPLENKRNGGDYVAVMTMKTVT